MLDEPRYKKIREQLRPELAQSWRMMEELDRKLEEVEIREQLRDNPSSNEGLYILTSLAQIVGNQEFEAAVRAESERREKTR